MSDDASYMAFLNKANADPKAGQAQSQSASTAQSRSKYDPTTSSSSALPASLRSLPDVTYTSDTDSPFEPVLFSFSGSSVPSTAEFAKCLSPAAEASDVEQLSTEEFDPKGLYVEIIQKVEQAGKGDVKVYRVNVDSTRVEYYVLTLGKGVLVGVVAKAVES